MGRQGSGTRYDEPAPGPAVILVDPQLPENIGAAMRAMLNCGLTDLRLVRPRDGWPNPKTHAAAVGAQAVLERARVFSTTAQAAADLTHLYAATARSRFMLKPAVKPRHAAREMRRMESMGESFGVLFGPERCGLDNDDVTLCNKIIQVPLNPSFSSLNLAHAVLLVAYEWYQSQPFEEGEEGEEGEEEEEEKEEKEVELGETPSARRTGERAKAATSGELQNFFEHLEQELSAAAFFRVEEKRPAMVRNLRNLFLRADLRQHEIQTLHGVVSALSGRRKDGKQVRLAKNQNQE